MSDHLLHEDPLFGVLSILFLFLPCRYVPDASERELPVLLGFLPPSKFTEDLLRIPAFSLEMQDVLSSMGRGNRSLINSYNCCKTRENVEIIISMWFLY